MLMNNPGSAPRPGKFNDASRLLAAVLRPATQITEALSESKD
jgi:hypothetical protein